MAWFVFLSLLVPSQSTVSGNSGVLANPAATLLALLWEEVSPASLKNEVRQVNKELAEIKTHLGKIEQAVIFGRDIKTIEFLVTKYTQISDIEEMDKWAETALEYGSDGFDRTIKSLEEMMLGTSQLFAEGSIFGTIVAQDDGEICTKVNVAFEYLMGLWTVSHAVWAQAYLIKKQNFETNAREKKIRAESSIANFEQVKDEALPDHCNCFQKDTFYADVDHLINPHETSSVDASSARGCQSRCHADLACKRNSTCFKHNNDNNLVKGLFL